MIPVVVSTQETQHSLNISSIQELNPNWLSIKLAITTNLQIRDHMEQ